MKFEMSHDMGKNIVVLKMKNKTVNQGTDTHKTQTSLYPFIQVVCQMGTLNQIHVIGKGNCQWDKPTTNKFQPVRL